MRTWGFLFATVVALLTTTGLAGAQEIEWKRQFGTSGFDVARAMAVDDSGVYVFGAVEGALPGQTYAGGDNDVFLRKYDFKGREVWTRQFGTPGFDFPGSGPIGIDDKGVYVVGVTDGALPGQVNAGSLDVFVRRYDFRGNEVWTRQFGTSGDDFADAISAKLGGVFVAGAVNGALPGQTPGGSWDAFIRLYDFDGNEVWTRQFGGSGSEDFHGIAVDQTGVYASGSATTLPDFGGNSDALVQKYGLDGTLVWSLQFGTAAFDHLGGAALKQGGLYVTGYTHGTLPDQTSAGGRDVFVRKYDLDGTEVWTHQFGTSGSDGAEVIGTAVDGRGVYVASNVGGALPGQASAGSADAFARAYDADGNELWTVQFGTAGFDRAQAIAVHRTGIYLSGRVGGTLPGQTSAGGQDCFVAKLVLDN